MVNLISRERDAGTDSWIFKLKKLKAEIWQMWAVIWLYWCLYLSTAPQLNAGYTDSDEVVTVGFLGGLLHPPGYPWLSSMVYLVTHLPIPASVAWRAHLLNSGMEALSLGIIWRCVVLVLEKETKKISWWTSWFSYVVSWVSVSMLGSVYLYWLYGSVTEKYALNNLLGAAITYVVVRLVIEEKKEQTRMLWRWLAGLWGVGILHHQTIGLLLPMTFLIAWKKWAMWWRWRYELLMTGMMIVVIGLGLLGWLNSRSVALNWHFPMSIMGWWRELSRQQMAGLTASVGDTEGMYFLSVSVSEVFHKLPALMGMLIEQLGWLTCGMILLGVWAMWKKRQKLLTQVIGMGAGVSLIGVWLYLPWPEALGKQAITMRMYLLGFTFIPLLVAWGWLWLITSSHRYWRQFGIEMGQRIWVVTLTLIMSWGIWRGWHLVRWPQWQIMHDHYQTILTVLPEDSMLGCFSDVSCFGLFYLQQVEQLRADVIVVPLGYDFVRQSLVDRGDLGVDVNMEKPQAITSLLLGNLDKRPVFVIDMSPTINHWLMVDSGEVKLVPYGYFNQLVKTSDVAAAQVAKPVTTEALAGMNIPREDVFRLYFKALIGRTHVLNAVVFTGLGDMEQVKEQLDLARSLERQLPVSYTNWVADTERQLQAENYK